MTALLQILGTDIVMTCVMCLLATICVAILMRFFVKQGVRELEDLFYAKFINTEKGIAIYETIKNYLYMIIGAVLTLLCLVKLYEVCKFPMENNKALMFFFFVPMYALQFFFDRHMKRLACKVFGIELPAKDEEVAEPREKIVKLHGKKYREDANGTLVPVEEA